MALHGCSLLENAGAYSPEQPLSSINALPKTFIIPAEPASSSGFGYTLNHLDEKARPVCCMQAEHYE
ncbi:hypothetical protein [Candidatus Colwellia aromaticivorans]|uniref:hypothetical protein n=1 Tax=Candidatus Colwellia aromaticivorans TaxID=2267621 RepID=UPI0014440A58|nr:hypothetical protein [Candidatus Colwellia aromaticivorans]